MMIPWGFTGNDQKYTDWDVEDLKHKQRQGKTLTRAQKDQIKKFDEKQRKKNLNKKKK